MSIFSRAFVIVALSLIQQQAYATTYYIDSRFGNDLWSGKLQAAVSSPSPDGPWQSLNRLSSAQLAPGDIIELQCGSRWTQTLRINNSGTPDRPITIRSASTACGAPPSIDGSVVVDAYNWVPHNNAIYKTPWPQQKLQNGSLASGVAGWTSWSATADQKLVYSANCPSSTVGCAAFTSSVKSGDSTAISNNFSVEGGITYSGEISLRIPVGVKVKVLVRRGGIPYEPISLLQWVTGTGAWQKINVAFVSPVTIANARLDIDILPAGVTFHFKNASLTPAFANPVGAWIGDLPLLPAYHPNRGYNAIEPNSVYAKAAADGNNVRSPYGSLGSTYIDIDSTLNLPQGVTPKPGNRLRIRTDVWCLDEATVTQVQGNRLYFEPATRYPIKAGQGYFLLGELGMLDSPGEWLFDSITGASYVWMPDSNNPFSRISLSVLEKGIDLSGRSNIVIEGLDIRYTGIGIDLANTQNTSVRFTGVTNTVREGILGTSSKNISITSNRIRQTGGDAISAKYSSVVRVDSNDISQSAVTTNGGRIWSLPATAEAAIFTGPYSTITGNRINGAANNGIWTQANWLIANGTVEQNAISNSCLQLNDCAAIVVNYSSPNTRITSNLIEGVYGNTDGLGPNVPTHAVGIYLDDNSTGMTVSNNTVTGADYGIQMHDAYNNQVTGNKLFGNRKYQLYMQEETRFIRAQGDLYGNSIEDNILIPDKPAVSLFKQSTIGLTGAFGAFDRNRYSALLSSRVVGDSPANGPYAELRFEEWQAMPASSGYAGDSTGVATYPIGYAASKITSSNMVPNGKLTMGSTGWSKWNLTPPFGQLTLENCVPFGPCLRYAAGASLGSVTSPNFSIQAGVWYRVSFDVKTGEAGQPFAVMVRRDGNGTEVGYEALMVRPEAFSGGQEWKRYTFSFKAAKSITANDPSTGERGARVDFEAIPAYKVLYVRNLEMVSITPLETGLKLQMVTNSGRDAIDVPCPDADSTSVNCANYVRFTDQTQVLWPLHLAPLESEIVFTRDPSLVDSDADGIADIQDSCRNTPSGETTDAVGCALAQIPG
jgi:parallel beta-helix repeat protein